jgi:uncharacterized membrane protein YkvA (DUF1232 family)
VNAIGGRLNLRVVHAGVGQERRYNMKSNHLLDLFNVVKDYRFVIQMMKDKRYTIPLGRKLLYLLLLFYIIIPFDFIPGIFPIIGMVDDLGAFAAIIAALLYEITAYRDFVDGIANKTGSGVTNKAERVEDRLPPADTKKEQEEKH